MVHKIYCLKINLYLYDLIYKTISKRKDKTKTYMTPACRQTGMWLKKKKTAL